MSDELQHSRIAQYMTLDEIYSHALQGLLCGYAPCCILYMLLRTRAESRQNHKYSNYGVVFCPECLQLDVSVLESKIQERRWLDSPFPKGHPEPDTAPDNLKAAAEQLSLEVMTRLPLNPDTYSF